MNKPSVELVLDAKAEIGEGPVWSTEEQVLYWTNIPRGELHRFDPASGKDTFWTLPSALGCFAPREAGGFVVGLKTGFAFFDPANGATTPIGNPEAHLPDNRMNDGRCDRDGRFWVGTMKDPQDPPRPQGSLYRLDHQRRVAKMQEGVYVANAMAFSPDGRIMYWGDSNPQVRTVWAFDLDRASGDISNKRVFCDSRPLRGRPDGACVDADGCYWFAANDGWALCRLTPRGEVDRYIDLPIEKPTMPAFGGKDLDTIFVTSIRAGRDLAKQPHAGGIFAVRCGVSGLPEPKYRG